MQEALEESVQMMKEAVDDLGATLAEAASASGAVGGMVDSINDAINKMEDTPALEPEGTFVDYQTTMVKTAKAIAVTVQEMVSILIIVQLLSVSKPLAPALALVAAADNSLTVTNLTAWTNCVITTSQVSQGPEKS